MLQPWDGMSLITANLGSGCVASGPVWVNSNTPTKPPFISSARASALESETRSESKMLSLQSFLRKGVSLGYVGLNKNLKDLKRIRARSSGLS
jgi:hypothetical protein